MTKDLLQFWPTDDAYANRRVVVEEEETQPVTTRLVRTEAIRGRVVHADGTPAAGIRLQAYGSGKKLDNGRGEALTGADGRYEMMVSPDEAYAVYVEDRDRAARSRLDVVVRRGKPAEGCRLHAHPRDSPPRHGLGRRWQQARVRRVYPAG